MLAISLVQAVVKWKVDDSLSTEVVKLSSWGCAKPCASPSTRACHLPLHEKEQLSSAVLQLSLGIDSSAMVVVNQLSVVGLSSW